jgi:hypothetical protein
MHNTFKKIVASLALAAIVLFPLQGCSKDTVENELNAVLNASEAVVKVAEPNAAWVPAFDNAITALEQAETQWNGGGDVAVVEGALATLEAVTAQIPLTAVYSPLIDVLVAGIDSVLAALPISTASVAKAHAVLPAVANPHRGRVALAQPKHVGKLSIQSHVDAVKAQWNGIVKSNPKLAAAKLK